MSVDGPFLVVGCGLIGTSLALALTDQGHAVHLRDRIPSNVELAVSRGAGTGDPVTDPQVVVVAAPPSVAPGLVADLLQEFPEALVTDVASVKSDLIEHVESGPHADRFVGGHPMAGKERSGPMAAAGRLFEGRPWAVVPTSTSRPEFVQHIRDLAASVGAVPRQMAAGDHDQAVAMVSHLPHLASVFVAGLLNDASSDALELAGPGLRDVTRIAGSETGLWIDILSGNADQVRGLLTSMRDAVDTAIDALDNTDATPLAQLLDAGRSGSQLIPGRHGGASEKLVTVYVSVPDEPGELSRLMAHTGESGVNIEDIRIDHELDRAVGQVEIAVIEHGADTLVGALTERGWAAHR